MHLLPRFMQFHAWNHIVPHEPAWNGLLRWIRASITSKFNHVNSFTLIQLPNPAKGHNFFQLRARLRNMTEKNQRKTFIKRVKSECSRFSDWCNIILVFFESRIFLKVPSTFLTVAKSSTGDITKDTHFILFMLSFNAHPPGSDPPTSQSLSLPPPLSHPPPPSVSYPSSGSVSLSAAAAMGGPLSHSCCCWCCQQKKTHSLLALWLLNTRDLSFFSPSLSRTKLNEFEH